MKKIWLLFTLLIGSLLATCCNKPENPEIIFDEISTESIWIIHDTEEWTISLNNWEESITIMDKNLWADVAWTWKESYWYYYQRWNNHWFQLNSEIKTWTELVSREESIKYGPNNWYDSDIQFVVLEELTRNVDYYNYNYLASFNDNLWWWSGDDEMVELSWVFYLGEYRMDTENPRIERQWPCPDWFHVPSLWDIYRLIKIWANIKFQWDNNIQKHIRRWSIGGHWIWNLFRDDLLRPMAGWIRFDGNTTPHDQNSIWYYRMSSPWRFLNFRDDAIVEYPHSYRAATFPVRCFKN